MFRSHISSRAKAQFTYLLSERSFRGRLLTDHIGKLLDVQVEPDITKGDSTGRGAKTLSGGEKSFSQVCLLLALWEAMGSPIRCLDELYVIYPRLMCRASLIYSYSDVYMDHINRKMAIDMLVGPIYLFESSLVDLLTFSGRCLLLDAQSGDSLSSSRREARRTSPSPPMCASRSWLNLSVGKPP